MQQVFPSLIAAIGLDVIALTWRLSWRWTRALRAAALLNVTAFAILVGAFALPVAELVFWVLIAPILALPAPIALALAAVGFTILNMAIKWPLLTKLFHPSRRGRAFKLLTMATLVSGAVLVTKLWHDDQRNAALGVEGSVMTGPAIPAPRVSARSV